MSSSLLLYLAGPLFLLWLVSQIKGRTTAGSTLAVSRFKFNGAAGDPFVLEIAGRPPGVMGFLLTLMGLDEETVFRAGSDGVSMQSSGLSGRNSTMTTYRTISRVTCGFSQPIGVAFLGGILALCGLVSFVDDMKRQDLSAATTLFVLSVAACVAWYYLHRCLQVSVETFGGASIGVAFQPSVIERVNLSYKTAAEIAEALEAQVRAAHRAAAAAEPPLETLAAGPAT